MKIRNVIIGMCFLSVVCSSCSDVKKTENNAVVEETKENYVLIGKKAILTYPELKAEVHYIDENTLHWIQVDAEGKKTEATEKISYQKLNEHQFFLNWIEKDGFTVSQVIDLKTNKVTAYLSYADQKSHRGARSADFAEGTFEIVE